MAQQQGASASAMVSEPGSTTTIVCSSISFKGSAAAFQGSRSAAALRAGNSGMLAAIRFKQQRQQQCHMSTLVSATWAFVVHDAGVRCLMCDKDAYPAPHLQNPCAHTYSAHPHTPTYAAALALSPVCCVPPLASCSPLRRSTSVQWPWWLTPCRV